MAPNKGHTSKQPNPRRDARLDTNATGSGLWTSMRDPLDMLPYAAALYEGFPEGYYNLVRRVGVEVGGWGNRVSLWGWRNLQDIRARWTWNPCPRQEAFGKRGFRGVV